MMIRAKKSLLLSLLVGIALIFTACTTQEIPETGPEGLEETGAGEAIQFSVDEELRALGAEVQLVGLIEEPLMGIQARIFDVNGEEIQSFEFLSADQAQQAAATISQTGDMIGEVPSGFIATPYFYHDEQNIILYVGQDQDMLDLLTTAFGVSLTDFPAAEAADTEPAELTGEMAGLAEELRQYGATVEPLGTVQQPFFAVEGRIIDVNGEEVFVFEFPTSAAAEEAAQLISPDGLTIGEFQPNFVAQPHFFRDGRLIAMYVGTGDAVLEPLTDAMLAPLSERPDAGEPAGQDLLLETYDLQDFTQDLQDAEADVLETQPLAGIPMMIDVETQGYSVNGQQIQAFAFLTPDAASDAANLISPDGLTIGISRVEFAEPPHFYQRGQLIVLYVGQDQDTLDLLNQILGDQIAGGPAS